MSENFLAEAATAVARILQSLQESERRRVINAALTLVGGVETLDDAGDHRRSEQRGAAPQSSVGGATDLVLRRLGLTIDQIESVLHFEDGVAHVIGLPGGQSKREQTMNIYLLAGLGAALSSADAKFSDSDARNLCIQFGCYDAPNHVRIVKAMGNKITGSKEGGWKLTSPGLSAAASLVKSAV